MFIKAHTVCVIVFQYIAKLIIIVRIHVLWVERMYQVEVVLTSTAVVLLTSNSNTVFLRVNYLTTD